MDYTLTVTGWDQLVAKCNDPNLIAEPLREFFNVSTAGIQALVQEGSPVDMGELRASIYTEIDQSPMPLYGLVSTRLQPHYAPDMEYGTVPHWMPIDAIRGWAQRHGMNPYAVQRHIAKYGTQPHYMFAEAALNSMDDVDDNLQKMADEIGARWSA